MNLPKAWQNRASSLLSNKCIVVFTTSDCKNNDESQIFSKQHFSHPNQTPSSNFKGTSYDHNFLHYFIDKIFLLFHLRLDNKIKSLRGCTDFEKLLMSVSLFRKRNKYSFE